MRLLPGVAAAIKRLSAAGALIIVVTNQPVVARGAVSEEGLAAIHRRMEELLLAEGARVDAVYHCPHLPQVADCDCRKPKAGMLRQAAARFSISPARSFMVGDSTRDIQAARNFGCRAVLVQTGNAGKDGNYEVEPDAVCPGLPEAAEWILAQVRRDNGG